MPAGAKPCVLNFGTLAHNRGHSRTTHRSQGWSLDPALSQWFKYRGELRSLTSYVLLVANHQMVGPRVTENHALPRRLHSGARHSAPRVQLGPARRGTTQPCNQRSAQRPSQCYHPWHRQMCHPCRGKQAAGALAATPPALRRPPPGVSVERPAQSSLVVHPRW